MFNEYRPTPTGGLESKNVNTQRLKVPIHSPIGVMICLCGKTKRMYVFSPRQEVTMSESVTHREITPHASHPRSSSQMASSSQKKSKPNIQLGRWPSAIGLDQPCQHAPHCQNVLKRNMCLACLGSAIGNFIRQNHESLPDLFRWLGLYLPVWGSASGKTPLPPQSPREAMICAFSEFAAHSGELQGPAPLRAR